MHTEWITTIVTVAGFAVSFSGSIFGLGFWLSGKFRTIEQAANSKHIQNLERFHRVYVALIKMGYKNGHHLEPPHNG